MSEIEKLVLTRPITCCVGIWSDDSVLVGISTHCVPVLGHSLPFQLRAAENLQQVPP